MSYTVYIIYSPSLDRFYIGRTSNLRLRIEDHNVGGSRYTKAGIPWSLLWYCTKPSEYQAHVLERKLKNLTRKKKVRFMLKYRAGCANPEVIAFLKTGPHPDRLSGASGVVPEVVPA